MPRPSGRKPAAIKADLHGKGVICVLYSMRKDQPNGHMVGDLARGLTGAMQIRHAEPQWWNLNHIACDTELRRKDLIQLEFEVTQDFCSDKCRNLFAKARSLAIANANPQLPIFVFIYRPKETSKKYYRVTERGEVEEAGLWD